MTKRIQKSGKATDLITFTRSSTGTYLDSVVYGDELVQSTTQSGVISNTNNDPYLTVENRGQVSISNDVLTFNNTQWESVRRNVGMEIGKYYKVSFTVNVTSGNVAVYKNGATNIGNFTTGTHSVIYKQEAAVNLQFSSGGFVGTVSNVSVREVIGNQGKEGEFLLRTAEINEPRIDYNADKTVKGLLIEGTRTNRVTSSDFADAEQRTTSGTGTFTVLEENKLGVFNGFQVASGGQTWHRVNKYVSVTSGTVYSVSFYYRYGTSGKGRFECRINGNSSTIVSNSATGSITVGSSAGGTLEFLSDEAFGDIRKLTCRWTPNATSTTATVGIATNSDVKGETIIAYAVQLEGGLIASSYIPTTTAMKTRNSDTASVPTLDDFTHNKVQGTTIVELDYSNWKNFATFARAYSWAHSGTTNILNEIYNNGNASDTGKLRYRADNGSGNAQIGADNIEGSENYNTGKVAFALKDNDMAVAWNGTLVATDASGQPALNLVTSLYIGSTYREDIDTVGDFGYAHIKSIKYYPVRLTNEQMKALTL